jgi:hypothetical protein
MRTAAMPAFTPAVARVCAAAVIALAAGIGTTSLADAAQSQGPVPDFSGYWVRPEQGNERIYYPPERGPGPLKNMDATAEFMIGDHTNSILLPHAAAAVKAHGDKGRAGQVEYPPWSLCWPTGVPLALNMAEPVQFLQTPDQVTILYQRGMQMRRIYLNRAHPANPKPSWYGDSVGHYENGDTLVVDTIAQDTRSIVDRFGSPRSDAMRVVERYTIAPDRKRLTIAFTVDDPKTFTTPWSAYTAYVPVAARAGGAPDAFARDSERIAEVACAENNRDAAGGDFRIPVDDTPDF